jgi:diacylglycerol kinase (ATP)
MASGQPEKKRILFIINPISGKNKKEDVSKLILAKLEINRFDIEIKTTQSAGHARKISKEAVALNTDVIVAVGGDGTINEVASEMINSDSVLGIIPRGSGNGLARHLGIPQSFAKAVQLINDSHSTKIDTATLNDIPFISIAGVGFDALVAREFAKNPQRGFITYFNIITQRFFKYKPKKYKLIFDNNPEITTKAFFISFANSNQFGYNTTIAPSAKLNDGKIDVCIVKKPDLLDIPETANLLLLKQIDKSEYVRIVQTKSLIVKRKKNKVVNIDGEPVKVGKTLHIKIKPMSLNVIIPKDVKKR